MAIPVPPGLITIPFPPERAIRTALPVCCRPIGGTPVVWSGHRWVIILTDSERGACQINTDTDGEMAVDEWIAYEDLLFDVSHSLGTILAIQIARSLGFPAIRCNSMAAQWIKDQTITRMEKQELATFIAGQWEKYR